MKTILTFTVLCAASVSHASDFLTSQMLDAAQPYINVPYEDDPGEAVSENGFTVYRPNHGLIQGARVAALEQDVIQTVVSSPKASPLRDWLQAKMSKDPEFLQKVSLMAVLHRAGRTDESDSITAPGKREKELAGSAAKFEKAAAKSGLHFTPQELTDFEAGIKLDGYGSGSNPDQQNLTHILRAAHTFDLVRLGWTRDQDIPGLLPELSPADTKKLFERASGYVDLTHASSNDKTFFELSRDTKKLAATLNSAVGGTSKYKAENCAVSDVAGAGPFQAVVRIQYETTSGDPAVKLVRVHTKDANATDATLFTLTKWSETKVTKIVKTVVHGPTKEDLSNLADAKACQSWVKANGPETANVHSVTSGTKKSATSSVK